MSRVRSLRGRPVHRARLRSQLTAEATREGVQKTSLDRLGRCPAGTACAGAERPAHAGCIGRHAASWYIDTGRLPTSGILCSTSDDWALRHFWPCEQARGAHSWPDHAKALAEQDGQPCRTGKSCRLRWWNHLDPGLKRTAFSTKENAVILEAHRVWPSPSLESKHLLHRKAVEQNCLPATPPACLHRSSTLCHPDFSLSCCWMCSPSWTLLGKHRPQHDIAEPLLRAALIASWIPSHAYTISTMNTHPKHIHVPRAQSAA